ncbi:threonine-phosphate decarboxylase CobD [Curvivirga sp.]|uniref:threonine-phosphate decarboxylase CobD n=1 Tax=Curvivirga sp. TaxID=2856848 RepID=UPI003B5B69DE
MKDNKHHGGDLGWAINHFGLSEEEWIDLSTGINQSSYPFDLKENFNVNALPSKALYDACLSASGSYFNARLTPSNTLLTPGSQFIISQLPHLFAPDEIAILYPTYGEHVPAWKEAGHKVHLVRNIDEALALNSKFILLVNPNNPDGKLYSQSELLKISNQQASRGGYLVIDEAFIDISSEESLSDYAGQEGLIILRSFGKFFGLAGIRLGTLLAPQDIIERLQRRLGPWAVSSITLAVATQAYQDQEWIDRQKTNLSKSSEKIDRLFSAVGCDIVGGTILYRLYHTESASTLFNHLGQKGIYLRHFEYNPNWLRVGVPDIHNELLWQRLENALSDFHS